MDLSHWEVFGTLSRDFKAEVRLAHTWGSGMGGYLVMNNDDVYCIGKHESGERQKMYDSPKKMDKLCGKGINSFHSSGYGCTLALTTSGKLYEWSLCYNLEPDEVTGFVPENAIVSQVAVGKRHMLALTSDGKVFSWGTNYFGELGIGKTSSCKFSPHVVNINQKIMSVVCSTDASFALTSEGDVLSWGRRKQNGRSRSDLYSPGTILKSKSVSQIVCGQFQGLALTKDGSLYCWGMTDDYNTTSSWIPRKICRQISPIVEIAGSYHNEFFVCRTSSQEIYVWGKWFGQIQKDPVQTTYSSVDDVFACADGPTMWRTVTVQPPSYSNVLKSFECALNDKETSDIEFVVDGKKIFAHRVFLKFRVPYFRTMFENQWKNSNQRVIEVDKFTHDVFNAFITYVYTERVQVKAFADLYGLVEAADYYNVQELLAKCEDLIRMGIREGNACTIYALAVRHNTKNLQRDVREFIIPRLSQIVEGKDFLEMDHLLSKQLIREVVYKRKLVHASDGCSMQKLVRIDSSNGNEKDSPA